MKLVIQRVSEASVTVEGVLISKINHGLLTLLGLEKGDTEENVEKAIRKALELRIFEDDQGKMNHSLLDLCSMQKNGLADSRPVGHLIVSQFTLAGDCRSGKRPSFINAEIPDRAKVLYEKAILISQSYGITTAGGQFQADMKVSLINDGPVTLILEF